MVSHFGVVYGLGVPRYGVVLGCMDATFPGGVYLKYHIFRWLRCHIFGWHTFGVPHSQVPHSQVAYI